MANPTDKVTDLAMPPDQLALWAAQYGPALHRYFARKAGVGAADDLVQEVFLHLQVRAVRVPSDNVERYLFTIAKHVLIDRFRAGTVRQAAFHESLESIPDLADDLSPERILEAKQDFARASSAIASLPPRMRMAFILHRFEKLSYSAVAQRMNISKSTVRDLMQAAIAHMLRATRRGS